MSKKILVPVDGSDHSTKAIEFAATTVADSDAEVHLLHVVKATEIPKGLVKYMRAEGIHESPTVEYSKMMGDGIIQAAEDTAKGLGIKNIESSLLNGDPAAIITEYAREQDFDMIVIGSRGLGSVKGLLLGSVSSKVCHTADKTCVTIK